MLFVVRTKTKCERNLQPSNLNTQDVCELHEFLGKLLQEAAENLKTIETLRKGPPGNSLQATYEYVRIPVSAYSFSCKAGHWSFDREGLFSQIAGWTPPRWCVPTTGSFVLARGCLRWGSAFPFMEIWKYSSFFIQSTRQIFVKCFEVWLCQPLCLTIMFV